MDFDNLSQQFDNTVNGWMSFVDNNPYISGALSLFLVMYAGLAAPKLPESIAKLFDNAWFRLVVFFLIIYSAKKNPTVAIIAAVGLMISMQTLSKLKIGKMMMASAQQAEQMGAPEEELPIGDMTMEEGVPMSEVDVPEEAVAELAEEGKGVSSCGKKMNFRNHFYPQYVNMKPDAYLARYTGNNVNGFDPNAKYASI